MSDDRAGRGVQCLRGDRAGESEFMTISYWESVEAMARFTGGDSTRIHHLDRDPEFLIELPKSVQILQLRADHSPPHASSRGRCRRHTATEGSEASTLVLMTPPSA